jgi:hypothetical protein
MTCKTCGQPATLETSATTLVGYGTETCSAGKRHDDNCVAAGFQCADKHWTWVPVLRVCECGWRGKLTCFCHAGEKQEIPGWEQLYQEATARWKEQRKSLTTAEQSARLNDMLEARDAARPRS